MKGGSVPAAQPAATSRRRGVGVAVLLGVGPVAVAVLEVDAEVLDRLARRASRRRARRMVARERRSRQAERRAKSAGVGRVLVQRRSASAPEPRRRVGLEQVRAAVDGMDRLPPSESPG